MDHTVWLMSSTIIIKILQVRTLIRKNTNIDDAELRDFFKTHDNELAGTRPNADQVTLFFEMFKLENIRIAQILDY